MAEQRQVTDKPKNDDRLETGVEKRKRGGTFRDQAFQYLGVGLTAVAVGGGAELAQRLLHPDQTQASTYGDIAAVIDQAADELEGQQSDYSLAGEPGVMSPLRYRETHEQIGEEVVTFWRGMWDYQENALAQPVEKDLIIHNLDHVLASRTDLMAAVAKALEKIIPLLMEEGQWAQAAPELKTLNLGIYDDLYDFRSVELAEEQTAWQELRETLVNLPETTVTADSEGGQVLLQFAKDHGFYGDRTLIDLASDLRAVHENIKLIEALQGAAETANQEKRILISILIAGALNEILRRVRAMRQRNGRSQSVTSEAYWQGQMETQSGGKLTFGAGVGLRPAQVSDSHTDEKPMSERLTKLEDAVAPNPVGTEAGSPELEKTANG